jgi:REP element-mobilizing transposase RayT
MSQSLAKIVIHVVYGTKNREPFLNKNIRAKLYAYTVGILDTLNCITITINAVEDHIHLLVILSKNITVSKMLEEIKKGTSRWLKTQGNNFNGFSWQGGYGAFSVSESQIPKVIEYINNQEQHHQKISFKDELKALLKKHNIEFNEQYLWS